MGIMPEKQKVLLIENLPSDFYNSRLALAQFLSLNGYDVYALIPGGSKYSKFINDSDIKLIEYVFDRNDKSFLQILILALKFRRILNRHKFDVVHSFRFQPNLIHLIAGIGLNHKKIIHITGLGIVFSSNSFKYIFLRLISQIIFLIQFIFADKIIVQNPDDINDIWASILFRKKVQLIYGSGVNLEEFNLKKFNKLEIRKTLKISNKLQVYICITRLLWEKGIKELIDGFLLVNNPDILLLIVGWPDLENPRHIPNEFITTAVQNSTNIWYLGKREDIPELLAASDVFIYPSYYREGVPRSLLEALAMSLPIITTDMPGCKLAVENGINGILIKPRSVSEICHGITSLQKSNILNFGIESRNLAENKFSDLIIYKQISNLY